MAKTPKKSSLQAALNSVTPATADKGKGSAPAPKVAEKRPKAPTKPSRKDTVLIAGHFPPTVAKQLRLLAVEEDTTNQALLEEALNLLFLKRGNRSV